jgi:hypothetical protein
MAGLFLDDEEIAFLTGIRIGRGGVSRGERQIAALRTMGIPFYKNALGRPIVARSTFEHRPAVPPPVARWTPQVLKR